MDFIIFCIILFMLVAITEYILLDKVLKVSYKAHSIIYKHVLKRLYKLGE